MSVYWAAIETLVTLVELWEVGVPILPSRLTAKDVLPVPAISLIPIKIKHSEAEPRVIFLKTHNFGMDPCLW